ncbi:MAG: response regulator receiver protein [Solirubrobacterales bacterium]|jgi:CheY-like chemotaxis protein|nr:response regulator receiver protein [Solirubrobacterales bacterium]
MDRALVVLHVEDSPSDRRLTADTLNDAGLAIRLFQVEQAEDGLAFLRQEGERFAGCPRPDMILLDLGLPGMSGRDMLAEIRADPVLGTIPVVVQTGDDDDRTLVETLGLGAHEFVAKPLTVEQLLAVVEYITEYA